MPALKVCTLMGFYQLGINSAFLISQKALIVEEGRLLVLENTADKRGGQYGWELPGGLLDLDESRADGLVREAKEETGLDISLGPLFAVWDFWEHNFVSAEGWLLDVRIIGLAYLCERSGGEIRLSYEHRHYRWASKDELGSLPLAQNSATAIQKYLTQS